MSRNHERERHNTELFEVIEAEPPNGGSFADYGLDNYDDDFDTETNEDYDDRNDNNNNNFNENDDTNSNSLEMDYAQYQRKIINSNPDSRRSSQLASNNNNNENAFNGSNIQVVVRKRPINSKEIENKQTDIIDVFSNEDRVTIFEPKIKVDLTKFTQQHDFIFDSVWDETATNQQIYDKCVKPLLNTIFVAKGKATCFGYGQTGSGKTYTLLGSEDGSNQGLYIMAVRDIFKLLQKPEFSQIQVIVSFYEIYGGKLYDLLADRKQILCREDGKQKVNIVGLTKIKCYDSKQLMEIIERGNQVRSSGTTGANANSSRSHALLSIDLKRERVKKENKIKLSGKDRLQIAQGNKKSKIILHGRISFIDLAGSERGADTASNNKQTRLEGAEINKSLLALKECIRALDQNHSHKPFRGSKLTQVLKESFIGNSKTIMIANISPNSGSCENTLNTLRYADRVKELKSQSTNNSKSRLKPSGDPYMPHIKSAPSQKSLTRNRSAPSLEQTLTSNSRPGTASQKKKQNTGLSKNNRKTNSRQGRKRAKSPNPEINSNNNKLNTKSQSQSQSNQEENRRNAKSNPRNRGKNRQKLNSINITTNDDKSDSNISKIKNGRQPTQSLYTHRDREKLPPRPPNNINENNNNNNNDINRQLKKPRKYNLGKSPNKKLKSQQSNNNTSQSSSVSKSETPKKSKLIKQYPLSSSKSVSSSPNKQILSSRSNSNSHSKSKRKRSSILSRQQSNQSQQLNNMIDQNMGEISESVPFNDDSINKKDDLSTKQLIRIHRKHIDEFMILIKEDMSLLKDFDKGSFSKDEYLIKLKTLLMKEAQSVNQFQQNFM